MKELILQALNTYLSVKGSKNAKFPVIGESLPNKLKEVAGKNGYSFDSKGGYRQTKWANVIWARLYNNKVSSSGSNGIYIVYLFKKDLNGVYLTLNMGTDKLKKKEILKVANYFKQHISSSKFTKNEIDLALDDPSSDARPQKYEFGTILSKYYSKIDVENSSEETLEKDLIDMCIEYQNVIDMFDLENNIWTDLIQDIVKNKEVKIMPTIQKATKDELNGSNVLYYGIPGCGKSYIANNDLINKYNIKEENLFRVTFFYDYSYADFVGQILPLTINDELKYKFVPGVFTRALKKAYINKDEKIVLIIEELNRGNAPAIFGEIFQLLDRKDNGVSEYGVQNPQIAEELGLDPLSKIVLPSNFIIFATMNTSDQNVFPLDTAFKRRWTLRYIVDKDNHPLFSGKVVPNIRNNNNVIKWDLFHKVVNQVIEKMLHDSYNCEDKGIGYFFIKNNELEDASLFGEKVFQYLWFDVFNLRHNEVFNFTTYKELIKAYTRHGLELFGNDESSLFKAICKPEDM